MQKADGVLVLEGLRGFARVELADGTRISTLGGVTKIGLDDVLTVTHEGDLGLAWTARPRAGGIELVLEVTNRLPYAVAVERLDVLVAPEGVAPAPVREAMQAGYQSWSFASAVAPYDQVDRPQPGPVVGPVLPATEAERFMSYGLTILTAGTRRALVGFLSARAYHPLVTVQATPEGHMLTASCQVEGRALAPGASLRSETLWLQADLADEVLLSRYASEAAREMGATPPATAPTGWCSWYEFYTRVTEADMRRNLDVLDAHRATMPVQVVQLDDGYQTAIGDWTSLNEKFPAGLKALVAEIHARGYQAGLWLAPFFVGEPSQVYRQHPDWVVRDEAGLPISTMRNWGHRNFSLDTTHPEVKAHLREVFRTIVDDWGFDYLKIDFLYAGAVRGRRHDPTATGLQAYRQGLELIREVAGPRFVLGCGAPLLASIGLVDGMRVGSDVAPFWADPDPYGSAPATWNAIRATLARHWMHGKFWVNDPDCLIVREGNNQLAPAEVETWATVVALSGGMVLLSDDMSRLEPARAAIIPRLLPPLGEAAKPHGPCVEGVPSRLRLARGERELVAIFNWHDAPADERYELGSVGRWHALDLWSGAHYGPASGPLLLGGIPAHGVRLLALVPALARPQLVASTLTLTGGLQEVVDEAWDGTTLTVQIELAGTHTGELVFAIPEGFRLAEAGVHGAVLRVPLAVVDRHVVELRFDAAGG
jgi:alpha-galactosidase